MMFRYLTSFVLTTMLMLVALVALGQVSTTTTSTVSLDTLLQGGVDTYAAFRDLGWLAGLSAAINLLINGTKFGPVAAFIKAKGWKWLRPAFALLAGIVGGFIAGMAAGKGGMALILYVAGGLMSGGGAIAIHEIIAAVKGDRK